MIQEDLMICEDLDQVKETKDMIEPGEHPMRAIDIKLQSTHDNTGKYIEVQFEITDGEFENWKVFQKFNIQNKSAKAVQISVGQIKSWIKACGFEATGQLMFSQIAGLEGQDFIGKVITKKEKGFKDKSVISAFKSAAGYVRPNRQPEQPQGLQKAPEQTQTSQPDNVPGFLRKQAQ